MACSNLQDPVLIFSPLASRGFTLGVEQTAASDRATLEQIDPIRPSPTASLPYAPVHF